jgi:hypothetical protein
VCVCVCLVWVCSGMHLCSRQQWQLVLITSLGLQLQMRESKVVRPVLAIAHAAEEAL